MTNKTDTKALKKTHRLELVMQETGEEFEVGLKEWRCLTVRDLVVDIQRQTYRIEHPGLPVEEGDVIAWLQFRYGWSFKMALTYLEKRKPDGPRLKVEEKANVKEREKTGGYIPQNSGTLDLWQKKAIELDGEGIRIYFSEQHSSYELIQLLGAQTARFTELIASDVDECEECGKEFYWEDQSERAYQAFHFWDEGETEDNRIAAFLYTLDSTGIICFSCMRKKVNSVLALKCCIKSASRRERKEKKLRDQEKKRIEGLARKAAKPLCDASDLIDVRYALDSVNFYSLCDSEAWEEDIMRAFANKDFYTYLLCDETEERNPKFWARVVKKYSV